jgi:hypothetical protein
MNLLRAGRGAAVPDSWLLAHYAPSLRQLVGTAPLFTAKRRTLACLLFAGIAPLSFLRHMGLTLAADRVLSMDGLRTPSWFPYQCTTGAYCAGASAAYTAHPGRNASTPRPLGLRSCLPLSIDAHAKHAPGQHPLTQLFWWEKSGSFFQTGG